MDKYITLKQQVLDLLQQKFPEDRHYYRGASHTINALNVVEEYIDYMRVGTYEAQILRLGVLMRDLGELTLVENGEDGIELVKKIMADAGYSFVQTKVVADLVKSTRQPHRPTNLLERIICDVDMEFLGREDHEEASEMFFQELLKNSMVSSREEWDQWQQEMLDNHKYHTPYGRERFMAVRS